MSLIMDFLCLELKVDYVVFDSWFSQPTLLHRIARTTIRKPFPACFTRGVRSFRHGFSKLPADCPAGDMEHDFNERGSNRRINWSFPFVE